MRICLLGDFAKIPDEGMRVVSRKIRNDLKYKNDILSLNTRDILKVKGQYQGEEASDERNVCKSQS